MPTMKTLEIWVLVDDAGLVVASHDNNALADLYEEHHQPVADAGGLRRVRLTITVPLPEPIEVSVDVPAEEGEPAVSVG